MKYLIIVGICMLLIGCVEGRNTQQSECYGNCIDAYDCVYQKNSKYKENDEGFDECKESCFDLCYNLQTEQNLTRR